MYNAIEKFNIDINLGCQFVSWIFTYVYRNVKLIKINLISEVLLLLVEISISIIYFNVLTQQLLEPITESAQDK
jgi:hypothetical protein